MGPLRVWFSTQEDSFSWVHTCCSHWGCGFRLFLKLKTSSVVFWVNGVSPVVENKLFCTMVQRSDVTQAFKWRREWDPCMVQKISIQAKTTATMGCGCCVGLAAITDVTSEELWADFWRVLWNTGDLKVQYVRITCCVSCWSWSPAPVS